MYSFNKGAIFSGSACSNEGSVKVTIDVNCGICEHNCAIGSGFEDAMNAVV